MNKDIFKEKLEKKIDESDHDFSICGLINKNGEIFPLGTDTKVLSTLFELFVRPILVNFAEENGFKLSEASVQNTYPDFTLSFEDEFGEIKRIAIDVKTTYITSLTKKFRYTLGGYTSFLREPTKNIAFHFDEYISHWVIGFVYIRRAINKSASYDVYNVDELYDIPVPYSDVEWFVAEKWQISGETAGSGNTTNIGSFTGTIDDFRNPPTIFLSEAEFLGYWRNYGKTASERKNKFSTVEEYRLWKK